MQTATFDQTRRRHSTLSGVSLKKLRHIAEDLNREYLKAGGATELELTTDAVRSAIGDSVAKAFEALQAMEGGSVPDYLLVLLPDDEAAFKLRCQSQPQDDLSDPEIPQPMVPVVTMPTEVLPGRCPRCQYRYTVPGESCPNCDDDDDDRPVARAEEPPSQVQHQPRPTEGFQFCPHCTSGEVLISGGTCPVCDATVDALFIPKLDERDFVD